jgi:hypothetical protein
VIAGGLLSSPRTLMARLWRFTRVNASDGIRPQEMMCDARHVQVIPGGAVMADAHSAFEMSTTSRVIWTGMKRQPYPRKTRARSPTAGTSTAEAIARMVATAGCSRKIVTAFASRIFAAALGMDSGENGKHEEEKSGDKSGEKHFGGSLWGFDKRVDIAKCTASFGLCLRDSKHPVPQRFI